MYTGVKNRLGSTSRLYQLQYHRTSNFYQSAEAREIKVSNKIPGPAQLTLAGHRNKNPIIWVTIQALAHPPTMHVIKGAIYIYEADSS